MSTFTSKIINIFVSTYRPAGRAKSNRKAYKDLTKEQYESFKRRQAILDFFGVPVHTIERTGEITFKIFMRDLFGLPNANAAGYKKVLSVLLVIPTFLVNIVTILLKTPMNILRLFTEILPQFVAAGADSLYDIVQEKSDTEVAAEATLESENTVTPKKNTIIENSKEVAFGILKGALIVVSYLAQGIFLLGRAITSPGASLLAALEHGKAKIENSDRMAELIRGLIYTAGLLIASLAVTIAFYTIAAPLVIKLLIANVPAFASAASTLLVKAANAPVIGKIFTWVVNAAKAVIVPIVEEFGLALSPLAVATASVVAAFVAVSTVLHNFRKGAADFLYGANDRQSRKSYATLTLKDVDDDHQIVEKSRFEGNAKFEFRNSSDDLRNSTNALRTSIDIVREEKRTSLEEAPNDSSSFLRNSR